EAINSDAEQKAVAKNPTTAAADKNSSVIKSTKKITAKSTEKATAKTKSSATNKTKAKKSTTTKAAAQIAEIKITHPERIIDPQSGTKKAELAEFYQQISKWILPHLKQRPVSLVRLPNGLEG